VNPFARPLLYLLVAAVATQANEPVPLEKLPKPVTDAVKAKFPKATLTEASKSSEDGKTEFVVSIKDAGKEIEVTVTPEGTITYLEKEIADRELPKAVAAAVKAKAPKATHQAAWVGIEVKDGKETIDYYWIELLSVAKRRVDLELTPDGAITRVTREITAKDLPKPVADAIQKKYPKADLKSLEVVSAVENGKEVPEYYSVELLTADKKVIEIEVAPDGKIE